MAASHLQSGGHWEGISAHGNSRIHNGNTFIQHQYVNSAPSAHDRQPDFVESLNFDHMDSRHASINPALQYTCEWVFETPQYDRWRDTERPASVGGFLWIKGKAGSGKSTIMKCALEHARAPARTSHKGTVISFFFNARGHALEKSIEGMYRSLLSQLVTEVPLLRSSLPEHLPRDIAQEGWQVDVLRNYFKQAVHAPQRDCDISIYVDALDECDEDDIREAIEHFEGLGQVIHPKRVRIYTFFASRYYPHITIKQCEHIRLDEQPQHQRDISLYIKTRLKISNPPLERELARYIQMHSSGIFLWVVLVVRIIKKKFDQGVHSAELRSALMNVPTQIENLLASITSFPDEPLVAIVQWVLFAIKPFDLHHLYSAVKMRTGGLTNAAGHRVVVDHDTMMKFILQASQGLVEVDTGETQRAQFIHESVKAYFLCDGLVAMSPSLKCNMVALSNTMLAQSCRAYVELDLGIHILTTGPVHGGAGGFRRQGPMQRHTARRSRPTFSIHGTPSSPTDRFDGFLVYALTKIFTHMELACEGDPITLSDLVDFPWKLWVRL